jgi:polysaccharide pyruvyl transferase WcaK-like protein
MSNSNSANSILSPVGISGQELPVATRPKIGLLDHMGGGNLGDDATQAAVISKIKNRWPDADIYGFSLNPEDTRVRHGIPAYAIRTKTWTLGSETAENAGAGQKRRAGLRRFPFLFWPLRAIYAALVRAPRAIFRELRFLAKSLDILRSFDLLIINGGGQLTEAWGGPWGFPYTIFKWTLLTRMAHVQCIFLNVGAGPLNHPLSRFFVRHALLSADYVSFRDEQSKALARNIGFKEKSDVFPDSVYGLDFKGLPTGRFGRKENAVVGFAPMAYSDPRVDQKSKPETYADFIRTLGLFGSWLIENGYSLSLFCSDIGIDPPTIADLGLMLRQQSDAERAQRITAPRVESIDDLLRAISLMDYVVTCRFHGVIFAHLLNKPVLALAHHPKVATLMADLGLQQYCLDIRTCNAEALQKAFISLVQNKDEIKSRMAERLACYQEQLSIQFDTLFPPTCVEGPDTNEMRRQENECA